ncbi:Ferroporti-1 [Aspergillus avenaceus]|uniref:Solute carrier family 40 member n=1 Tax=Aspergillus avenaceus TaxID=36643 RepID=A0A5N6TGH7_ASPAV|nr:Ferroporti-1 [Aspergillus avenaceus]
MSRDSSDITEPFLRPESPTPAPTSVLWRLYISHWLSTWNSRMFEFGAVLFLASIFPGTLLYASIYALVRSFSAVVLSSWLGSVVDRSDRLKAIRQSIIWQRLPVALSCGCFVVLLSPLDVPYIRPGLFAAVILFACLEKLASAANTVAVERDWAIVVSDALQIPRQDLNASMRRIDLFCKLIAPVVISLVDSFSTKVAIWTVLGVNTASMIIEYVAIAQVYERIPQLKRPEEQSSSLNPASHTPVQYLKNAIAPWREYISSRVFPASLALSLLYLTVLSFGSTMVTYLLHTGFHPLQISSMRIGAVIAELSGTWAAPVLMNRIGPIRTGLWFLNWQCICLAGAATAFIYSHNSQIMATGLVVGVALSRIGLWGFDLSVQLLIQDTVSEDNRARFSATEVALQNIFELLSFATTVVFPHPNQFQYPVYISVGAVTLAAICFAAYVRKERGHLLHLEVRPAV